MIRWPIKSARAISKLFKSTQNLDIFIEDQGDEQFYTLLFRSAAPEGVVVTRVVALGGCEPVKNAALTYMDERPALFLIDGDLQWVRGEAAPVISRLYRLNCYCIENILLCERLVATVAAEELMCSDDEALENLKFFEWRESMRPLVSLFARFAVLNKVAPEIATISNGFSQLVTADPVHKLPVLCEEKVKTRMAAIDEIIHQRVGASGFKDIASVERRIDEFDGGLLAVSGKDFLLPLLFFYLKLISGTRISVEQFRFRLASNSLPGDLPELRRALEFAR